MNVIRPQLLMEHYDNYNSIMIRSEILIQEAVAATTQKFASPVKPTKDFTSNIESVIVAETTGHNHQEMENKSFLSIKALARNIYSLPDFPHATFSHYGTAPKIVSCGHTSTLDSCSLVHKILSSNRNKSTFCDADLLLVLYQQKITASCFASHSLSKSTNISQLSESSIVKYDKILQNRQATSANAYFSRNYTKSVHHWELDR